MSQIEGFVSIGTGGTVNAATASGTTYGLTKGCSGVPTGWAGAYSGVLGLYGAGVNSVSRIATGTYAIALSDPWVRLDSIQVQPFQGSSGPSANFAEYVVADTVGLGNSFANGLGPVGSNPNSIVIQFVHAATDVVNDLPVSAGFYIDLRLRDSLNGPQ